MKNHGVFVTGTGTDIGKTYVSALLVKEKLSQGVSVGYYKPALSGAIRKDGALIYSDAAYVINTAGLKCSPFDVVSYGFEEAVSPHLAAERCGVTISREKILSDFQRLRKDYDFMVVEGAGGLACPLHKDLLLPEIIQLLDLPIVIVADAGLGTINHGVLTASYAKDQGLTIHGFILNRFDSHNFLHVDNKKQLKAITGLPVLRTVALDEV